MSQTIPLNVLIGIAASVFSTASLLPQLIKILKEKKAENLSVSMLIILMAGLLLWIAYGVILNDPIIITANAISVIINLMIIIFSLKYKAAANGTSPI